MMSQWGDPINSPMGGRPTPFPLGYSFANKVEVDEIDYRSAKQIYRAHHSYLPSGRDASPVRHGIYLGGNIVGAISYSNQFGNHSIEVENSQVVPGCTVNYQPDQILTISRICIGLDMPNLASCALAKSQDRFIEEYAREEGIRLLTTYVREDYQGSMLKALSDKGWRADGHISRGHQAGNREEKYIWEYDKHRWVCEISDSAQGLHLDTPDWWATLHQQDVVLEYEEEDN